MNLEKVFALTSCHEGAVRSITPRSPSIHLLTSFLELCSALSFVKEKIGGVEALEVNANTQEHTKLWRGGSSTLFIIIGSLIQLPRGPQF